MQELRRQRCSRFQKDQSQCRRDTGGSCGKYLYIPDPDGILQGAISYSSNALKENKKIRKDNAKVIEALRIAPVTSVKRRRKHYIRGIEYQYDGIRITGIFNQYGPDEKSSGLSGERREA